MQDSPDLVGDRAGEFDGGAERELHDVDEVGLGESEQRGAVDVVRAKSLQGGKRERDRLGRTCFSSWRAAAAFHQRPIELQIGVASVCLLICIPQVQ